MTKFILKFFLLFPFLAIGQYHFEKFKSPKHRTSIEIKLTENGNDYRFQKEIPSFFNDNSSLKIAVLGNTVDFGKTEINISTNLKSKKYIEEIPIQGIENLYIADFNGDGQKDFKIVGYFMGCGLASQRVRIIYFFQQNKKQFIKVSFDDFIGENAIERDLDGDGNFEIITKTLQHHKNHNYWLFNLYNFENNKMVCVNGKMKYPIMVAYLFKDNYKITTKLSYKEVKKYEIKQPDSLKISN